MVSTVRIDGSLPDLGDDSTRGLIFSGGWGVEYEFAGAPPVRASQPRRLSDIGFPAPFDRELEGALRGRRAFSQFLYLFKNGKYLTLHAATMLPAGPIAGVDTASNWGLPVDWVNFDAVLPGRGKKMDFCYFLRGSQYMRFDWNTNAASPGYPKFIGAEWHLPAPFNADVDGVVVGQSALATKAYVFKTLAQDVDVKGAVVPPGPDSMRLLTPGYARYDFNDEAFAGTEVAPRDVSSLWEGLNPLLDAGPAIDTALSWCDAALAALAVPATPALAAALSHHFMSASPSPAQVAAIANRMQNVRNRIADMPHAFQWRRGFDGVAQTVPGALTEIGDKFSNIHGPNGRAAVLIHEAVHFTFSGGISVDVPEWSGETINGTAFGVDGPIAHVTISGIPYRDLSTDQAIENPGSYAAFAQEMFFAQVMTFGADTRFGFARRHE